MSEITFADFGGVDILLEPKPRNPPSGLLTADNILRFCSKI